MKLRNPWNEFFVVEQFFNRRRRERNLKIACAISRDEILVQLIVIINKGTWPGQVRILGDIFKIQGRSFSSRSHWLPLVHAGNLTVTSKNCSLVTAGYELLALLVRARSVTVTQSHLQLVTNVLKMQASSVGTIFVRTFLCCTTKFVMEMFAGYISLQWWNK